MNSNNEIIRPLSPDEIEEISGGGCTFKKLHCAITGGYEQCLVEEVCTL